MTTSQTLAHRLRPFGGLLVAAMVLFYAPLSLTYFTMADLHAAHPTTLQDRVMSFLVSPSFAYGVGSGHDDHIDEFLRTYATMWVHSVAGTAAIVFGLLQFSTRLRTRMPRFHRLAGRIYLLAAVLVSTTAISYLLQTPSVDVFSGAAFEDVLWLLAVATFVTSAIAFVAIIRGHVVAHLELMALSFALMCSAPFLRVGWLSIAPFWESNKEMINLTEGIWAGPFLFTCAIVFSRRYGGARSRGTSPLVTPAAARWSWLAFAVGLALLVPCVLVTPGYVTGSYLAGPEWFDPRWQVVVASFALPYAAQVVVFAVMATRSERNGNAPAYVAWRTFFLGQLWAPLLSSAGFMFATVVQDIPADQAWYAAGLGWNFTVFASYVAHTLLTAVPKKRAVRQPEGALA